MTQQTRQEIKKSLHTIRNHLQIIYLLNETHEDKSEIEKHLGTIQTSAEIINDEVKNIENYL